MVSSVFCPELRRQSQPQQFLSTSLSFSFDLIWLIFSYTSSILNFSYHRFLSPLEPCPKGSFSPMISNLSIRLFPKAYSSLMQSYPCFISYSFTTLFGAWQRSVLCSIIIAINSNHTNN